MIESLLNNAITRALGGFFRAINDWIISIVNFEWVPELFWWYWYLFLLFMVVSVVIYIFGWSRVVKIGSSIVLAAAAIFVAGGHFMRNRLRDRAERSSRRRNR